MQSRKARTMPVREIVYSAALIAAGMTVIAATISTALS